MKKEEPEFFHNRTEVAKYLGISRMTLHRWEKTLPLKGDDAWNRHIRWLELKKLKEWKKKLERKRYVTK